LDDLIKFCHNLDVHKYYKKIEPTPINKSFSTKPLKILPKLNVTRAKIIKPDDS